MGKQRNKREELANMECREEKSGGEMERCKSQLKQNQKH